MSDPQGKISQADAAFRKALRYDPKNLDARTGLQWLKTLRK